MLTRLARYHESSSLPIAAGIPPIHGSCAILPHNNKKQAMHKLTDCYHGNLSNRLLNKAGADQENLETGEGMEAKTMKSNPTHLVPWQLFCRVEKVGGSSCGSRGAKGAMALPAPVKTSHKRMAASCGALYFMFLCFLAPPPAPPTILDPMLISSLPDPLITYMFFSGNS